MLIVIDESGQAINTDRIESVMVDVPPKKWIVTMFSGEKFNISEKVHEELLPISTHGWR